MINRNVLSAMKPTSYLINLGRGKVVDEEALIEALERGKIAGAALDTFEATLAERSSFWSLKNHVTPHAARSERTTWSRFFHLRRNLRRFLKGRGKGLINLIKG
jgi:phosphoglycerate dehydrogenase-like enzyme